MCIYVCAPVVLRSNRIRLQKLGFLIGSGKLNVVHLNAGEVVLVCLSGQQREPQRPASASTLCNTPSDARQDIESNEGALISVGVMCS